MLRVALFTERGRCWEYSRGYKLSILFVFARRIIIFRVISELKAPSQYTVADEFSLGTIRK